MESDHFPLEIYTKTASRDHRECRAEWSTGMCLCILPFPLFLYLFQEFICCLSRVLILGVLGKVKEIQPPLLSLQYTTRTTQRENQGSTRHITPKKDLPVLEESSHPRRRIQTNPEWDALGILKRSCYIHWYSSNWFKWLPDCTGWFPSPRHSVQSLHLPKSKEVNDRVSFVQQQSQASFSNFVVISL